LEAVLAGVASLPVKDEQSIFVVFVVALLRRKFVAILERQCTAVRLKAKETALAQIATNRLVPALDLKSFLFFLLTVGDLR